MKMPISEGGDQVGNVQWAIKTRGLTFPAGLPASWGHAFLYHPWCLLPPPGLVAAVECVVAVPPLLFDILLFMELNFF